MREAIELKNISLANYHDEFPSDIAARFQSKYQEWISSDFAGFRKLLDKGSTEYPDFNGIKALVEETRIGSSGKKIIDFVLLGTGGSSLGPETLIRCLRPSLGTPRFHFMDNNDPEWFSWLLQNLNPESTLFYAVSKSGKTPETISQLLVVIEWLKKGLKESGSWKKHVVLATDPEKGDFRELARTQNLQCLDIPSSVGGRFSVLTAVGLFPAIYAGLSGESLISGARSLVEMWEKKPLSENPAAKLARALAQNSSKRPITVLMPYSSQLGAFSRWFCQLWAESLGKNGKGFTPFPAIGTTDQHSQMQLYMEGPRDKTVLLINVRKPDAIFPLADLEGTESLPSFRELSGRTMRELFDAEFRATRDALTNHKVANATIELDCIDEYSLGALFYFWEWTTLYAGAYLEVNPFDQPGVEAAKILTKRYLLGSGK